MKMGDNHGPHRKIIASVPSSDPSSSKGDPCRWESNTIAVPEEQDPSFFTFGTLIRLDPLADTHACPHTLQEAETATSGIAAVMLSHDGLDRFSCLIGVVKGNRADIVVKNMGLNDAVKKGSTDETKLSIDCCSGTTSVGPSSWCIVR